MRPRVTLRGYAIVVAGAALLLAGWHEWYFLTVRNQPFGRPVLSNIRREQYRILREVAARTGQVTPDAALLNEAVRHDARIAAIRKAGEEAEARRRDAAGRLNVTWPLPGWFPRGPI